MTSSTGQRQDPPRTDSVRSTGRLRQSAIYSRGVFGARPTIPTSWPELDRLARRRLSRRAYGYVAGGAGSEYTMRADRDAFERRQLLPRMLRDVCVLDTSVLGWRPRDLDQGYLPFALGDGIAQYTSDPVFRSMLADRAVGPTERP